MIIHEYSENEIVLYIFAGSGTVGVVCKELNRNYILIDKEETNIQLIKKGGKRKNKYTNMKNSKLCNICNGVGMILLKQDGHRSEGWIPCPVENCYNGVIIEPKKN